MNAELVVIEQEPVRIWERQPGEPHRYFQLFERYRLMGPDRAVTKVHHAWQSEHGRNVSYGKSVPKGWRAACVKWQWVARAEAWDLYVSQLAAEEIQKRRLEILTSGYALQYERVRLLKDLAVVLEEEAFNPDKRWLPDVKQIGQGDTAERVDLIRFNEGLINQLRGLLDDLAKETAGRRNRPEMSVNLNFDFKQLTDEQLDRLINGEDPVKVIGDVGLR